MNQTNQLETTIRDVTVFIDRARITRAGKMDLETGCQSIEITDLPTAHLEPDSVRVQAEGTAKTRILGVDVKKRFFVDTPPGKAKELTDQLQTLLDENKTLSDTADSVITQIKHLDGLSDSTRTYAMSLAKGKTTIEAHGALIDFITTKRMAAQAQLRENLVQSRQIDKKIKKLERDLKQIQNVRPTERYTAVIDLEVLQAGELDVRLTYMFRAASWKPLYDIRLQGSELEVGYLAQVTQSSGEDWGGVSLTLSTARPSVSVTVPELKPWYIYPYSPPPPPPPRRMAKAVAMAAPQAGFRGEPDMAGGMDVAEAAFEPEELQIEDAQHVTADVRQTGAFVTYHVGEGIDIPGNGSPHKTTIALFKLAPEFDFIAAPKLEELAYRRVRAANDSPYMLLPGPAQLFNEDDFIGSVPVKLTAPNEKLKLYFGSDDRIRIKRELVSRDTEKIFMADKRRVRYAYEIKVENHTGETQKISLRDQLPVSRREDIKVKFEEAEPKIETQDEMNRLEWNLQLTPKAKTTIRFDFSIEYPRDTRVVGLPD